MNEDIFDVVNDDDEIIGRELRSVVHARELLHRAVHVLVYNAAGQLFLQKRSMAKDTDWSDWKLISNLPYSVASPLLVDLAAMPRGPGRLVVTLQLEVAQRLCAVPGTKEFSKLTLLIGCRYEAGEMFRISPHCFFPEPRVDSACLTFHRRAKPLFDDALYSPFKTVVKRAFSQRRKMMRKNLKGGWPDDKIDAAMSATGLDVKIRAEKVSLVQFVELTQRLHDE